jgi:hypothetical protein
MQSSLYRRHIGRQVIFHRKATIAAEHSKYDAEPFPLHVEAYLKIRVKQESRVSLL